MAALQPTDYGPSVLLILTEVHVCPPMRLNSRHDLRERAIRLLCPNAGRLLLLVEALPHSELVAIPAEEALKGHDRFHHGRQLRGPLTLVYERSMATKRVAATIMVVMDQRAMASA